MAHALILFSNLSYLFLGPSATVVLASATTQRELKSRRSVGRLTVIEGTFWLCGEICSWSSMCDSVCMRANTSRAWSFRVTGKKDRRSVCNEIPNNIPFLLLWQIRKAFTMRTWSQLTNFLRRHYLLVKSELKNNI